MLPRRGPENFSVDFETIRTVAAVALRRWAQKNHISARGRLADALAVSPSTVDEWLSGTRYQIPTKHLKRLPDLLGFSFTCELFVALRQAGEEELLQELVHCVLTRVETREAPRYDHARFSMADNSDGPRPVSCVGHVPDVA